MSKDITVKERLIVMETKFNGLNKTVGDGFDSLRGDIKSLSGKFDCLDKKYVSRSEFFPIKQIVYGLVTLILVSVAGGLVKLVLAK